MEEKKYIGFSYGILCKSLEEQAREQGYILKKVELFEDLKKALNMISIHHIANESETQKLFTKLHKKVIKNLEIIKNQK